MVLQSPPNGESSRRYRCERVVFALLSSGRIPAEEGCGVMYSGPGGMLDVEMGLVKRHVHFFKQLTSARDSSIVVR